MARSTRQSLLRLGAMLRPHAAREGRDATLGMLVGIAVVGLQVLRPWPLKWIIDHLSGTHGGSPVMAWLARDPLSGVALLSLLFVVTASAEAIAEYAQTMLINGLGNRILFRFRSALFSTILRQPLAFHESREVGEILTRVIYDTSRLRRGLNGLLLHIVQPLVLFVATFTVLLWIDPALGAILALGGSAALLMMQRRGRRIAVAARKQRVKEGSLASLVSAELHAIRELQASGRDSSAIETRFAARNTHSLRQEQKTRKLAAGLSLRVDVVLAASIALALWLGTRSVMTGHLTAGDMALFFSYALGLRASLAGFAAQTARMGRALACGERLEKLATRATPIIDPPGALALPDRPAELRFEEVGIRTPKARRTGRKWTLEDLTCTLPGGKRTAVVGPNGAGKSMVLSLLLRLREPDTGRILLDGRALSEYALDPLRSRTSVVFQDSVLAGISVRDNIALGLPDASLADIEAAAGAAKVSRFIARLPQGYDTIVRRGGDLFSGGERQRLMVARALLRDGTLWLLDEPTTGLDHATAAELTTMLLDATRDRTTLWVTHDPELIARVDWVLVLDKGRAAFSGTPEAYEDWRSSPEAGSDAPV
ncbi:MAG: ABC transporter ATP-binding protein [Gemmatimonadota bacterium]